MAVLDLCASTFYHRLGRKTAECGACRRMARRGRPICGGGPLGDPFHAGFRRPWRGKEEGDAVQPQGDFGERRCATRHPVETGRAAPREIRSGSVWAGLRCRRWCAAPLMIAGALSRTIIAEPAKKYSTFARSWRPPSTMRIYGGLRRASGHNWRRSMISPPGNSMGRSFELMYGGDDQDRRQSGHRPHGDADPNPCLRTWPLLSGFSELPARARFPPVAIRRQVRVPGSIPKPLEHARKSAHLTLADNGSAHGQTQANPGDQAAQRPPGRQDKAPAQGQTGTCPPSSSEGRCQESPTRAPQDVASAHAQADTCPPNLATLPEIARQFRPTRNVASGEKPDAYLADPVACALNSSKPTRQQDFTPAQEAVATCPPTAAASLPDRGGDRSEDNPSQRLKLPPAHGQADICPPNLCTLPEYVRQDRPARVLTEPSPHEHAVACSPADGTPEQGAGKEKANAGNRRRDGNDDQVHAGIEAFAAMLDWGLGVRAAGSELWLAYVATRERNGWPDLAPNVFGKLIKVTVEARGGWKRKSSSQFYGGVRVPLKLRTQMTWPLRLVTPLPNLARLRSQARVRRSAERFADCDAGDAQCIDQAAIKALRSSRKSERK